MRTRVALIGLGAVGELHLREYLELDSIEVVGAADLDGRRRDQVLSGTSVPGYADHLEMLAELKPDIACVLTPAATHETVVRDCADAGANVLCEKPMALSVAAAERMSVDCGRAGVQFCYGASYRYLPAVARARELVEAGAIGDVQLMSEAIVGGRGRGRWPALPASHYPVGGPGGSGMGLVDHGIHLIDLFRWLTKAEVLRAVGRGNVAGKAPVTEFLHMSFSNGAAGLLTYNDATFSTELPGEGMFSGGSGWDVLGYVPSGTWCAHPGSIQVFGTEGSLRIFHYTNTLFLFDASGIRELPLAGRPSPGHFGTQIEAFASSLRLGIAPPASASDGTRALAVALSVYDGAAPQKTDSPGKQVLHRSRGYEH